MYTHLYVPGHVYNFFYLYDYKLKFYINFCCFLLFSLFVLVYSLKRTKAVKLTVLGVTQSDYNYCRLFDFRNVTFTKNDVAHPVGVPDFLIPLKVEVTASY